MPTVSERLASHVAPKLAIQLQSADASILDKIHLWDLIVVDSSWANDTLSSTATGFYPSKYVGPKGRIRRYNSNAVILAYYSPADMIMHEPTPYHAVIEAFRAVDQDSWYVKDALGEQVLLFQFNDGNWTYFVNLTVDACTTAIADIMGDVLNPSECFDGAFYDWGEESVSWLNSRTTPPTGKNGIDFDLNGIADTSSAIDSAWRTGFNLLLTKTRAQLTSGSLILTNGNHRLADGSYPFIANLNGAMFEGAFEGVFSSGQHDYSWDDYMRWYAVNVATATAPRATFFLQHHYSPIDYAKLRFGLASSLLFDGYYCATNHPSIGTGAYSSDVWLDEYAVDVQTGESHQDARYKGWLGAASGEAFNPSNPSETLYARLVAESAVEDRCWRRNFENGIVVVNPTSSTQVVNLGATYYGISGSQAGNNGAEYSSVSLASETAIVLLTGSSLVGRTVRFAAEPTAMFYAEPTAKFSAEATAWWQAPERMDSGMIFANNGRPYLQTANETKTYVFDVSPRFAHYAATPTLSSATSILVSPEGTTTTLSPTVSGNTVTVAVAGSSFASPTVGTAYYQLDVLATFSNAHSAQGRAFINVID